MTGSGGRLPLASRKTAFETSRTGYPVLGFSQVAASQKFVSEEAVALMRHSA